VLGDQISEGRLSSLRDLDTERDTVLFAEVGAESTYVRHHKQKIVLVFAAMRHFAERLHAQGVDVRYVRIDDPANAHDLVSEISRALAQASYDALILTEPGEWRLHEAFVAFAERSPVPVEIREDDRFIASHGIFQRWAEGRATLRMETFYRHMRERTGLLMDGDEPCGGRWNFDSENRRRLPRRVLPPPHVFAVPDEITQATIADVQRSFADHFGDVDGFSYPVTPMEAERVLADFLDNILPGFGDYQDAMAAGEPWLWHSIISAAMNVGLLDPLDVCRRAEQKYREGAAPLNAVEGFIRQILGWREFMRGVYWLKMPDYKARNALDAREGLPSFYWSGETEMACVRDVVASTKRYAYAHHIQRLMVTGNFAMLLGVRPQDINDWYMTVFADAYEWVELPNTHGMATFADGGIVGSKPYAAAGAYINRMSDYCGGCRYDVKQRIGEDACPFNALYWDFLSRHEKLLGANVRLAMPYSTLRNMGAKERGDIATQAEKWRREFCGPMPT
jgi:deoxyribodipyrimidine photolyase-related protein